ncbi:hypothetical protein ACIFOC_02910 [Leucobacter aridicollis]|uniref:DUF3618 domain-containing protein n=1 Tax=Leucobacter aridicollis TaxID=283878 RepID=A0A852RC89_9MICO|nr:DUF3618 domain-containing protein [Leucobacter aridicollis]MBL3680967.1 DUF3618 domain-containing protein [Leucobacter aridicollis]MCS3429243.1 hypothetical protein [Leucobacter aridicollis]NYD28029.1 hypothetical protein [Leucobacter aridicollis]RKQ85847.1 uncharacterized protein DUF3618 [Mycolicibacterium mucogenicum 261Sha1.1M5]
MNSQDRKQLGIAEADAARAELYDTLGQLSDRLNYAKRIDDATQRVGLRIREERTERPLVFVAGVVAVAATAGVIVWAIAKRAGRNFRA